MRWFMYAGLCRRLNLDFARKVKMRNSIREAGGTKGKGKRTMSRGAPSIAIVLRSGVGTGRNACATKRRGGAGAGGRGRWLRRRRRWWSLARRRVLRALRARRARLLSARRDAAALRRRRRHRARGERLRRRRRGRRCASRADGCADARRGHPRRWASCALVFADGVGHDARRVVSSLLAMALSSSLSASQCEFAKRCAWRCQSASVVM